MCIIVCHTHERAKDLKRPEEEKYGSYDTHAKQQQIQAIVCEIEGEIGADACPQYACPQ